ncbi:hypothetical protein Ae201684P_016981 [Aphanomyces euteiches]|uniref:Uncharacterized protein n=1 Tax=Aphanomyces euteiches TaxID=100861 RepID=A0A6G0WMU3_9STRA|nr:hypothetical protein Ae201684_013607 [Aphanomyces euteiches]KAH9094372.1 hypothetical protein Ae201684P_016981 [Aphanomyces euteiches]
MKPQEAPPDCCNVESVVRCNTATSFTELLEPPTPILRGNDKVRRGQGDLSSKDADPRRTDTAIATSPLPTRPTLVVGDHKVKTPVL